MMKIAIIDYGAGNIRSVINMMNRLQKEPNLDFEINVLSLTSSEWSNELVYSHYIFPGQGRFDDCMKRLQKHNMIAYLENEVLRRKKSFLGICVGMQILFDRGIEGSICDGLGWIRGEIRKLPLMGLKIPHMGWNSLHFHKQNRVFSQELENRDVYFAHSYAGFHIDPSLIIAKTNYGIEIPAIVKAANITGMQFHPEKSHKIGMQLIREWIEDGYTTRI